MNDEISIPVALPLDDDGFLRRECPTCKQEFKWFAHEEGDPEAEPVDHYYCPRCGQAAGTDQWWTQSQLKFAERSASPEIDRFVTDALADAFKGIEGVRFEPNHSFSLDGSAPAPLVEPNDMIIVEAPCHPNEPLKVPVEVADAVHCLVCGNRFSA